ncbi:heme o synthase [Fibrella sp. HMF5335]|uniref:Protoheme IX farnesyltransferase n=1 Tax=Fibrella rubiginis TaxID=2817060 RepID=A0A939GMW8_9BACT|nr:heme o synthase [Fibrella rubiginis]MBO0939377.1 heme o synthase [Fibrella rubiginis]
MSTPLEVATEQRPKPVLRPWWYTYFELLKFRLSFLVAFSGVLGYMMGAERPYSLWLMALFSISGLLVTGAANAVNQVLEVEFDRLMQRTGDRPLPSGRLSKQKALIFVAVTLFIGLFIQTNSFNPLTAGVSFVSFLLYGFVYTPLKRVGSIAVYVGAIPGGLPPLIGWIAATGTVNGEAWWLFALQFVWQFTHFWAVAWVLDNDYAKAGFKLLPLKRPPSSRTAWVILLFTIWLLPLALVPYEMGYTGVVSSIIATVMAVVLVVFNIALVRNPTVATAKRLMFSAFAYLPIVQIAFVIDRV